MKRSEKNKEAWLLKNVEAVLLDLDDTLLDTNIEAFVPRYLQALGHHLHKFLPPDDMIQLILQATRQMVQNNDASRTNEQVFMEYFFKHLDVQPADILPHIKYFYDQLFPELQTYTKPIDGVSDLVNTLVRQKYKLVIATNPLFPAKAIYHRIRWAGLTEESFNLITTYENSHFTKPNYRYFEEILAQIQVKPQHAIMVGDDPLNDIKPADKAGLQTFWINGKDKGTNKGTLSDFQKWIATAQ
ncbi:MAG: HAD-IA family hydrolase [Caldithrix sp.]|nr:HAD-IA family hydrolase [Caldithrix sp.]